MSQSHNTTDSQALVQSMLQKLKIQSGREDHAYLNTPVPNAAAGRNEERGFVNGFGAVIALKDTGPAAVASQFGQSGETQQLSPVVRGSLPFSAQKANINGNRDHFDSGAQHPFSNKDALTRMHQNPDLGQGFTPRRYAWSLPTTNANIDAERQDNKLLHVGNGECGPLTQKDVQIILTDQKPNGISKRKLWLSEIKTRKWTQKIKERLRDKSRSSSKNIKEEQRREEQKRERGTDLFPQSQLPSAESFTNSSNKVEELVLPSLENSDPSMRLLGDFEFGLGSFSLLEEITTGQEWAKFLNLNQSPTSANQTPSTELTNPPNSDDSSQSFLICNDQGDMSQQSSLEETASILTNTSLHIGEDMSDGPQGSSTWSEPMEHGHASLPAQLDSNSFGWKSRSTLNRKRQHQSAKTRDRKSLDFMAAETQQADSEESTSWQSLKRSHSAEETVYTLNSPPPPLSPSTSSPFAPPPRGVLKHSISHDSESSTETDTKRRRVEENRRVRFSEEVVTIFPPQVCVDETDSEVEDSEPEEDSETEENVFDQAAQIEEAAPARRPVLRAWMLGLKRGSSLASPSAKKYR